MHHLALLWAVGAVVLGFAACDNPESSPSSIDAQVMTTPPLGGVSPASKKALAEYEKVARDFLAQADADAPLSELQPLAQRMLELGVQVVPDYVGAVPDCKAYLEEAAKIESRWATLDPEVIERDYHQDGALPPMPQNVDCYHMKDVVVHPATALALLAQPVVDREQVRLEISEVVSHAIAVRTGSGFNSDDGD